MGPPMDEKPVEEERQYEAQATAGRVYTPPSWGIGKECMRPPDLGAFLKDYDWDEMDIANRNKLERIVFWARRSSVSTPKRLHSYVCVVGKDYQPMPLAPNRRPPPGVRQ